MVTALDLAYIVSYFIKSAIYIYTIFTEILKLIFLFAIFW